MFLRQSISHGKPYLSFVQGYRDEFGKVKQKTIEKLGYLEDLKNIYDDPISHFKEIAKQRSNDEVTEYTIKNLNSKKIDCNSKPKNLGYFIAKNIYDSLDLSNLLSNYQKKSKVQYNINDILSFLVFMRIIYPASKKATYENKDILFENYDFSLDDIYRSLSHLNTLKNDIQKVIWNSTKDTYKRDTSTTYYDCTNYYFEIEYNDDDIFEYDHQGNVKLDKDGIPIINQKGLRKRGPEKNHRPDPIVEMGLLMDASFIPLSYDLFPGNESEKNSLIPIVNRTKNDFDLDRTIIVADRGLNTSDNIIQISGLTLEQSLKKNGYVYGQSVRGADEEFKSWVLNQEGYKLDKITDDNGKEITFKHKSRIHPKKMYVIRKDKGKTESGNKKRQSVLVDQKQMVYYSQKYADKQKRDREMIIKKANDLISHPEKYTRATSYGVSGYVNNLKFIKDTGEIANANLLSLNEERIREEEKYDGYYSIVTSEEKLSDIEIRNIYRGLSKIEETFKITKTELESRPVYVWTKEHIESHFLTCFIALYILRLLEHKTNKEISIPKLIESIKEYECTKLSNTINLFDTYDTVIEKLAIMNKVKLDNTLVLTTNLRKFLNY